MMIGSSLATICRLPPSIAFMFSWKAWIAARPLFNGAPTGSSWVPSSANIAAQPAESSLLNVAM